MSAHTPGPWRVGDGQHSNSYRHEVEAPPTPRGRRIVTARIPTPLGEPAQADANARLVAAAPDLLAALKDIVEQADRATIMLPADLADSIRIFGRAAIAKAEKGTP